jgi:hypothetical protein
LLHGQRFAERSADKSVRFNDTHENKMLLGLKTNFEFQKKKRKIKNVLFEVIFTTKA